MPGYRASGEEIAVVPQLESREAIGAVREIGAVDGLAALFVGPADLAVATGLSPGSPEFNEAAEWAQKRLRGYGLSNVHAESWGPFGRPYSVKHYSVEMTEPRYSHLNAMPLA